MDPREVPEAAPSESERSSSPGPRRTGLREAEAAELPRLLASDARPVLLVVDHPEAATRVAEELARTLHVPMAAAWGPDATPDDPYAWAVAQLRQATHVRHRVLAKVLEGRIEELGYEMQPNPLAPRRTEPRAATLRLSTTDDERILRLEGPFAAKLWHLSARVGDVIQIDRVNVRVSLRPDRERAEGWVQEERDFVWTSSLRERDLAEAAVSERLLGTGDEPHVPSEVSRRVDDEVRREIAAGRATLLPGILLLHEAHRLPPEALVALRRAARVDGAPLLLLNLPAGVDPAPLAREFPEPVLLTP